LTRFANILHFVQFMGVSRGTHLAQIDDFNQQIGKKFSFTSPLPFIFSPLLE